RGAKQVGLRVIEASVRLAVDAAAGKCERENIVIAVDQRPDGEIDFHEPTHFVKQRIDLLSSAHPVTDPHRAHLVVLAPDTHGEYAPTRLVLQVQGLPVCSAGENQTGSGRLEERRGDV